MRAIWAKGQIKQLIWIEFKRIIQSLRVIDSVALVHSQGSKHKQKTS